MSKFTPGPWKWYEGSRMGRVDERIGVYQVTPGEGWRDCGRRITFIEIDDPESGEDAANARLIAASPTLLAACKALLECADYDCDDAEVADDLFWTAVRAAREAIAKAGVEEEEDD